MTQNVTFEPKLRANLQREEIFITYSQHLQGLARKKMAEMLLFDGVEIKSLFRVLRAELIASQDGLTTSEIKSCYKTYFGKVTIYTFCLFLGILKLSNGAYPAARRISIFDHF